MNAQALRTWLRLEALPEPQSAPAPERAVALRAVFESLETELCRGLVVLPAWSTRTERIRRALLAAPADCETLAALVADDPGLAIRVLALANAAPGPHDGRALADLVLAMRRIGTLNLVSALHAHLLAQLRQSPQLHALRPQLVQLWDAATQVGALARRLAWINDADAGQALLAGLLHNAGRLYFMVRLAALGHAPLLEQAPPELLWRWQARLGAALARAWELPPEVAHAVARQGRLGAAEHDAGGAVLAAATYALHAGSAPAATAAMLAGEAGFALNAAQWRALLQRAAHEGAALRRTLGD